MALLPLKRLAFFAGFGLLPFWASIAIVYLGAHQAHVSAEYWAAAPWLIVMSLPACGVTLAMTAVTLAVYERTVGDHPRKLKRSILAFVFLNLAVTVVAGFIWIRYNQRERDLKEEELHAIEFVKNHKDVASVVGNNFTANVFSKSLSGGEPHQYDISVSGSKQAYAIVNVSRTDGKARFSLACITPLSMGQRDPFKDPCNQ